MGGSSSRFDETNWNQADGKLTSSEETIDNAPPSESYSVYYLTKLGVNQREYSVTDSDSNLLYSTRAVEGTLAWFDVLGPDGDDDFRLRVSVDLSRRYWLVHRYGMPAFRGQMWDESASERVTHRNGWHKPLFRRACITVTLSRYHAVVDFFEPASPQDKERKNGETGGDDHMTDEKKTDDGIICSESNVNSVDNEESHGGENDGKHGVPPITDAKHEETNRDETDDIVKSQYIAPDDLGTPAEVKAEATRPQQQSSTLGESIRWMQTKALESVAAPYQPANLEEGMITLNNPVLKVQEINSIVGQHQTMLIQEEEARKLKREELLMEAKLAKESQATGDRDVDWGSDEDPLNDLWYDYSYHESEGDDETSRGDDNVASTTEDADLADDSIGVIENGGICSVTSPIVSACSDSCLLISSCENESELSTRVASSSKDGPANEKQPLVGFWSWDNSLRVHRMKMHLASGSDLALHIILAVVTNQLRYERHATVAVAI